MIIFYDLETTGLNQYHDKITEICLIKYNYFTNQTETFNTLINPEKTTLHHFNHFESKISY